MNGTPWSKDEVASLRKWDAEGLAASLIAERLGRSRLAVRKALGRYVKRAKDEPGKGSPRLYKPGRDPNAVASPPRGKRRLNATPKISLAGYTPERVAWALANRNRDIEARLIAGFVVEANRTRRAAA